MSNLTFNLEDFGFNTNDKVTVTESAYAVIDGYEAYAEDAQGNKYKVQWEIVGGYDSTYGDESMACDWDEPDDIVAI